ARAERARVRESGRDALEQTLRDQSNGKVLTEDQANVKVQSFFERLQTDLAQRQEAKRKAARAARLAAQQFLAQAQSGGSRRARKGLRGVSVSASSTVRSSPASGRKCRSASRSRSTASMSTTARSSARGADSDGESEEHGIPLVSRPSPSPKSVADSATTLPSICSPTKLAEELQ
ncbi:unnamed protein product, partial [Polarella glacialis]